MTDTTNAVLSDLVSARELAGRWGCTVGHLANLRSAGLGPTYLKIGTSVRYRISDLIAYVQAHTVETA